MSTTTTPSEPAQRRAQLRALGLYGLAAQDEAFLATPWLDTVVDIEDRERHRRSLKRRLDNARLGPFKPLADFDWHWPKRIERALIDELLTLAFLDDATNVVLFGPNGVGKTLLAKNLTHRAILAGHTARFTMASDMLHDLASQHSDLSLARRLRRYTQPAVHLPAGGEAGFLLQGPVEFDRVSQQLGDVGIGAQLADQARGVKGGTRGEPVLFQQHDFADAHLRQMPGGRTADDAATHDDDAGLCRKIPVVAHVAVLT